MFEAEYKNSRDALSKQRRSEELGTPSGMPLFLASRIQAKVAENGPGNLAEEEARSRTDIAPELANSPQAWTQLTIQRSPQPGTSSPPEIPTTSGTELAAAPASPTSPLGTQAPVGQQIVPDSVTDLSPGQMRKSEFLGQVRVAAQSSAEQVLSASPLGTAAMPRVNQQLESFFAMYAGQDAQTLELSIRQQIPGAGGVNVASAFIPLIAEEVRQSVAEAMPKDDVGKGLLQAGESALGGIAESVRDKLPGLGGIMFKAKESGPNTVPDPGAVQAELTGGHPLDGATRSRMEAAFGEDFAQVRVHTGAKASGLSQRLNARAFTVGRDIAFAEGEYRPGSLVGDALMAHELAHVLQQKGATSSSDTVRQEGGLQRDALEDDADTSAVEAVLSLWTGTKAAFARFGRNAMPALRSGLKLKRCSKPKTEINPTTKEMGERIGKKMGDINAAGRSLDTGIWYWPEYRTACESDPSGVHKWDEAKYRLGFTTASQFTKTGDFEWTLNEGASASGAIQGWIAGLTVADCASTATAIYYDTLRAAVGNQKFDEYFAAGKSKQRQKRRMVISQYPQTTPLKDFLYDAEQKDGLATGDWYYFANHPSYKFKHPAGLWQGENAIYLGQSTGKDRWSGFGAENKSTAEMLDELLSAYNAGRTPDDERRLKEIATERGGTLPPEYVFKPEGKLNESLGSNSQIIVDAGGGLQATGWRLSETQATFLKEH